MRCARHAPASSAFFFFKQIKSRLFTFYRFRILIYRLVILESLHFKDSLCLYFFLKSLIYFIVFSRHFIDFILLWLHIFTIINKKLETQLLTNFYTITFSKHSLCCVRFLQTYKSALTLLAYRWFLWWYNFCNSVRNKGRCTLALRRMISRDDFKNKYKTKKNRAWMEDVELQKNIKLCECGCVSCVLGYL